MNETGKQIVQRFPTERLVLLLIAVGVIALVFWRQTASRETVFEQATAELKQGKTAVAQKLLNKHLESNPDDVEARWVLALSLVDEFPADATEHFKQIPISSKHYIDSQKQQYLYANEIGQYNAAEAALNNLLDAEPDNFGALLAKAELYFHTQRFTQALPLIRKVIKLDPERSDSYLLLADTFKRLNRVSESVEPLGKAALLSPSSLAVHASLADSLHFTGDLDGAESAAKWCLQQNHDLPSVRTTLAKVYRDQGKHDEAITELDLVLADYPDEFESLMLKAEINMFDGRAEEALKSLQNLYSGNAQNRRILSNLSRAAMLSGRQDLALKYQKELEQVLLAHPRSSEKSEIQIPD